MKKVLILSISTGQGHHTVGQTLKKKYEMMGHNVRFVDAYEYVSPFLSGIVSKGYLASTKYMPTKIARLAYDLMLKKDTPSKKYMPISLINAEIVRRLKTYIENYNPDIVICTHVLSAMLTERLKSKKYFNAVTCGIVTDFTVHPLWQNAANLDFLVTPSELLDFQMQKKGIEIEKIYPLGLPIAKSFVDGIDSAHAKKKLKLDENKNTILVMGGSMGHGNLSSMIERIDNMNIDIQGIAVCGRNKRLFNSLRKKKFNKNFRIYGWTNNISMMMDASDTIITKPGGITVTESLVKKLPMILQDPIAGHEERNAEFLQNSGLAFCLSKTFDIEEAIYSIFRFPERLSHMKEVIRLFSKPNSTENICNLTIQESDRRTENN